MKIEHFINGVNFHPISKIIIDETHPFLTYSEEISLRPGDIIWCKIDFVGLLFDKLRNHASEYILITHRGDWPVNENLYFKKPRCIKKWFAQNVNYQAPDLIPLPIGIENHWGPGKGGYTDFKYLEESHIGDIYTLQENRYVDKLYCNFNAGTNSIRGKIVDSIGLQYKFLDDRLPYPEYCKSMARFLFVLSPPGNGLDCHRTWEALYLGCIPVVQKHFMYDSYADLPIIQVEDWGTINRGFFQSHFQTYKEKFKSYKFEKLSINYWADLILK